MVSLVGCGIFPLCFPGAAALAAVGTLSHRSAFLWRAQAAGSTGNTEATVGVALLLGVWMLNMVMVICGDSWLVDVNVG